MLSGKAKLPELIPTSTEQENFGTAFVPIANAFLIFFLFIVIEYAASVITSRGVSLIKEASRKYTEAPKIHEKVEETQEAKTATEESESCSI